MKILMTSDHDQFKKVPGNRPVEVNHVNDLIALNAKENMLWMYPGTITKDGYLIDGQHRLEACRAQGWKFPYIISDKTLAELGDSIVALTNTAQKGWRVADFVNFYAQHGREQYIFLAQLMDTYKTNHPNILTLITGHMQTSAIKHGDLKIYSTPEDKQTIIDMLDGYAILREVLPYSVYCSSKFTSALRVIFQLMNAEQLKSEIIRAAGVTIEPQVNREEYLRLFERVCNWHRMEKSFIRFF